jgi:hypothetical protein
MGITDAASVKTPPGASRCRWLKPPVESGTPAIESRSQDTPSRPRSCAPSTGYSRAKAGRSPIGGGTGRHTLWLARRGLDVTLADIFPVALEIAQADAVSQGVPLRTLLIDLEAEPFPAGPWDLIVITDFLWRPLFGVLPTVLAPGGWLVVEHPTDSNLRRHSRPGPRHLLRDGELPRLVRGLEVMLTEEGWTEEGRHEARLIARRPGTLGS